MPFDPDIHHRRSIRLRGYDYSQFGAYFITICTQNRECLFGDIVEGEMVLNDAGKMVNRWYCELGNKFPDIQCGEMVVMPNHIHFIVINVGVDLVGADLRVCPDSGEQQGEQQGEHTGSPLQRVVQWFKTMTTNEYIRGVKSKKWPRFDKRLWQRNYWEHIICNENEYQRIARYIRNNPAQWEQDQLNTKTDNTLREPHILYNAEPWMV